MGASTIIAVLALVFAVVSFWYINARQGRLKAYEPHTFAARNAAPTLLLLTFPLVLRNTGPRPIVVQNMSLRFPDEPRATLPIPWRKSYPGLDPRVFSAATDPAVFAVAGFAAEQRFIEFGAPMVGIPLERRPYKVEISAKLGHRRKSRKLLTFTLLAGNILEPEKYLVYRNSLPDINKQDQAKAAASVSGLIEGLNKLREENESS